MSSQPVQSTPDEFDYNLSSTEPEEPSETQGKASPRVIKPIPDKQPEEISKAASELGKLGGKAAAEKRREAKEVERPETEEAVGEDAPEEAKRKVDEEISAAQRDERKKLASDRVAEATRAAAEAKREAARERQEREALARRLEALERERTRPAQEQRPDERPRQAQATDDDPEPQEKDFQSWEEYVKATGAHAARKEWKQLQKKQAEEDEQRRVHADIHAWKGRFVDRSVKKLGPEGLSKLSAEVQALKPTYDAIMAGEPITALNAVADEILDSPVSGEVMLYLSEHPNELQRLATLRTPRDIAREMAKLETRLESAPLGTSPSKPEGSKAKPPVRPVTGAPVTADADPDDDTPYDEYVRIMNAREKRSRR